MILFPDYLQVVDTPMDLQTVKEELLCGNYQNPMEFAKDMRQIFHNSRSYNTNQFSRVSSQGFITQLPYQRSLVISSCMNINYY